MKHSNSSTLIALSTAAMLLPGLSKKVDASSLEQVTTFDYKYSNYKEGEIARDKLAEGSGAERYTIDVNQFKFKTAISSNTEISVSGVQESMTGASPWYIDVDDNGKLLQAMSGATIEEERTELGLDARIVTEKFDSSISFGTSKENDYQSFSGGLSGAYRLYPNLTVDFGANYSKDYIDATDVKDYPDRPSDKTKNRFGTMFGASFVATKTTLLGASFGYSLLDGYLTDAYKAVRVNGDTIRESRPDTNGQFSWTIMWREFFPKANAALHVDYGQYSNDWELSSRTVKVAWYQNIGKGWQIIPSVRHYQQTAAIFYKPVYDVARADNYHSSDYRLSEFSANNAQIKLLKNFDSFYIDIAYESYSATGDNPGLVSYEMTTLGVGVKF